MVTDYSIEVDLLSLATNGFLSENGSVNGIADGFYWLEITYPIDVKPPIYTGGGISSKTLPSLINLLEATAPTIKVKLLTDSGATVWEKSAPKEPGIDVRTQSPVITSAKKIIRVKASNNVFSVE